MPEATKQKSIAVYKTKCRLCGALIYGTKEGINEQLKKHIDNDCKTAKDMRKWEKEGIFDTMMSHFREIGLKRELEKLMKKTKSTPDELREILDSLEAITEEKL